MGVYHRIGRWQMLQGAMDAPRSEHGQRACLSGSQRIRWITHMIQCLRVRYAKRGQAERGGWEMLAPRTA